MTGNPVTRSARVLNFRYSLASAAHAVIVPSSSLRPDVRNLQRRHWRDRLWYSCTSRRIFCGGAAIRLGQSDAWYLRRRSVRGGRTNPLAREGSAVHGQHVFVGG